MLEVKKSYAEKMEREAISDLVRERKGILILDLDHTLFQVTLRPITQEHVGFETWSFATEVSHSGRLLEGKTYWFHLDSSKTAPFFIHLRPGMYSFLSTASKMFELYAYTQGTGEYARKILTGIDPGGEFFGSPSRLIAREVDPNTGSTIRKSLSRVFPNEEDLVLIIDDRDDVWDSASGNLIKLSPFLFFIDRDREKLFSVTPTSDPLFHPNPRLDSSPQPVSIVDRQLHYLELALGDLHSEVFFAHSPEPCETVSPLQQFSVSAMLAVRKAALFQGIGFVVDGRIGRNVVRQIQQHGGRIVDDHKMDVRSKHLIHLGVPGQARQGHVSELIHPWFVLFCISTLSVPLEHVSKFSLQHIEEQGIASVWECVGVLGEVEDDEADEADLLNDLLG